MTRVIKTSSVLLFLLLLCLPALQKRFNFVHYTPLNENRYKEPKPDNVLGVFDQQSGYAEKFEKYFNDTYGFRDFLIRLNNQIDYSLFNRSGEIVIGPDGWLFYKSVVEKEQITIEKAPEEAFQKVCRRIVRLNDYLKERGITLIVVPAPQKNALYPEYVPSWTAHRPSPTRFDRYREFLRSRPEIQFVDVQKILEHLKPERRVFHKTDFHWNDPAAFSTGAELVNLLGKLSGTGVTWDHPLKISVAHETYGGQNNSLAIFWPEREAMLMVGENPAFGAGVTKSLGPFEWSYTADERSPKKLLPPTVMFGDSFSDGFLRSGLTLYFSSLTKYHERDLKKYLAAIPQDTKFVILEHVEVAMSRMLADDHWPDELK